MTEIRKAIRRLTGQPQPVPPGTGQRIQEREQAAAKARLLDANRRDPARRGER